MRLLFGLLLLAIVTCIAPGYEQSLASRSRQQSESPTQTGATTQVQADPTQAANDRYSKQFSKRIAGREKEAAARVFKNIQLQWFKDVPAAQLINIMNFGYSRALGVTCTHCHVEQDFASDEKRPKRAAREMAFMHRMINEQLGKMQNLVRKPEERFINCATCHRGAIDPRTIPFPARPASE